VILDALHGANRALAKVAGTVTVLKGGVELIAGEVLDASMTSVKALNEFYDKEIEKAGRSRWTSFVSPLEGHADEDLRFHLPRALSAKREPVTCNVKRETLYSPKSSAPGAYAIELHLSLGNQCRRLVVGTFISTSCGNLRRNLRR
jgi:hypothetical protein